MKPRHLVALAACAFSLAAAGTTLAQDPPPPLFSQLTSPPDERTPQGLVARLYERNSVPATERELQRFFTRDLAIALSADAKGGEVGAIDGDYRYDAQDMEPRGLTLDVVASGPNTASIEARFRNFGEAKAVRYQLCRRGPKEWRISDVVMPSGDIRALLNLPSAAGTCA